MSLFDVVNQLKLELDALRPISPEQEARILQKFRLDWNYNSNAIEGNSLTLGETRSLLLHGLTAAGKPIRDHLDVKGHNEAVLWLEEIVRDERPLTEQFIRGMHEVLLGEAYEVPAQTPDGHPTRKVIQPGRYKSSPNNVLTATGEIFYFASPEETPSKMMDLVDWYRHETERSILHPVALAAEFHYRFVRIHPFDDGNGRMSRLLMNLILMRRGYPMTVIKATDRNQYLTALSEADAGDLEPFFDFIAENVATSLELIIRAAKGESIEESDDLDKKLALLKKQLATREDFGRATWNPVTQARLYESVVKFWAEDLANEMMRFHELFMENRIHVRAIDNTNQHFSGYAGPTLTQALEFMKNAFTNGERLIKEIRINIEWDKFLVPATPFNLGFHAEFKFTEYRYSVNTAIYEREKNGYSYSDKPLFNSSYPTQVHYTLIKAFNHQLAEQVFEFIAEKVNRVDAQNNE